MLLELLQKCIAATLEKQLDALVVLCFKNLYFYIISFNWVFFSFLFFLSFPYPVTPDGKVANYFISCEIIPKLGDWDGWVWQTEPCVVQSACEIGTFLLQASPEPITDTSASECLALLLTGKFRGPLTKEPRCSHCSCVYLIFCLLPHEGNSLLSRLRRLILA